MFKEIRAAEAVAGNEDLKREILLRLPAKSVTRFKLVSKQWCSLISDPQFVQSLLLRRNPNKVPKGIFFCRSSFCSPKDINFISLNDSVPSSEIASLSFLNDIFESTYICILQSCNGLFLCRFQHANYCIFNPTTRQYRLLPQPREECKASGATLAFDPSVSPAYKVIIMTCAFNGHGGTCEIDIYSSESQSWSFSTYGFQLPGWVDLGFGHFFNGAIHWVGKEHTLCFDVYSEEMLETKPGPGRGYRYLGEDGIHFHLVTPHRRFKEDFFILEMSRDFSNWVNKYKVSVSAFPEIPMFNALCVVKGDREEDSALVLKMPDKLASYNFMTKEVKTICALPSEQDNFVRAYPYMETLYSV